MNKMATVFIILLFLMISCGCGNLGVDSQVGYLCKKRVEVSDRLLNTKMIMYQDKKMSLRDMDEEWYADDFIDAMNVGWNLGDSLESRAIECGYDANLDQETFWGNPRVTKDLIDYVASLGFNTIRIPVSWCYNSKRDENGHLIVGQSWLNRVHEVVDYAIENNMYVIINTMHDSQELLYCGIESSEEWEQVQQDAEDLWVQIANSFRDYDKYLIFEAYNEIDNITMGWTYSDLAVNQMNILNQIFVDSVRSTGGNNIDRILIIPTLFSGIKSNITGAFLLPKDSSKNKLVISVHCYAKEFDQDIEWIFQSLEDFSKRSGAPVLIDEFGASSDYILVKLREEFTSNFIARAANHGIKCCIWDDGYKWKIIDRYNYENSDTKLIKALFNGLEGIAYETNSGKKIILDSMNDFYFGGMDLSTGLVSLVDYESNYWASLTSKTEDDCFLTVEDGDKIVISMKAINGATEFWINGVTFFDKNLKVITYTVGKNILQKFLCVDIPEGAAYYAVSIYDPYNNHKQEQIEQYLNQGDLKISVTFINNQDNEEFRMIRLY